MSDLGLLVRLQARVMAFLAELPTDRLIALAHGRATLAVLDGQDNTRLDSVPVVAPPVTRATSPPATMRPAPEQGAKETVQFDPDAVIARLRACETVDEAAALMATLRLKADQLKVLAKVLKIPYGKTKDDTIKKIITLTVGARSKHLALRQM